MELVDDDWTKIDQLVAYIFIYFLWYFPNTFLKFYQFQTSFKINDYEEKWNDRKYFLEYQSEKNALTDENWSNIRKKKEWKV